jgi:hypothetical protein
MQLANAKRTLRRSLAAAIVLAFLFAAVALRDLNGLLTGMHTTDAPTQGAGAIVTPFASPNTSKAKAARAIEVWRAFDKANSTRLRGHPTATPKRIFGAYLFTDAAVFVVSYWLGLLFLLRRFRAAAAGDDEESKWRRQTAAVAWLALPFLVVFDELENVTSWWLVTDGWADGRIGASATAAWIFTWLKLISALCVLVPTVFLAHAHFRAWRKTTAGKLAAVRRLRVHSILVLVLGLLLLGHEQIPDLIRRWTVVQLGWTVVAALVLSAALWITAARLVAIGPRTHATGVTQAWASYLVIAILLLVAVGLWAVDHWTRHDVGWGLLIPAVLLAVVALPSLLYQPPWKSSTERRDAAGGAPPKAAASGEMALPENPVADQLLLILPAVVLVLLGLAAFHSSFAYAVYYRLWEGWLIAGLIGVSAGAALVGWVLCERIEGSVWWREPLLWALGANLLFFATLGFFTTRSELNGSVLVTIGGLLGFAGWSLYHTLSSYRGEGPRPWQVGLPVLTGACAALWGATIWNPWAVADSLGGLAIILAFLAALALLGWLLVWVNDGLLAPPALSALALKRIPILTLLALWFVLASVFDHGGYGDVRTIKSETEASISLETAWRCWLEKNGLEHQGEEVGCRTAHAGSLGSSGITPLVLVATTGGGIRAAYWTTVALDCAFEVDARTALRYRPCFAERRSDDWRRSNSIFALSGISGGSLGLAAYAAYLTEKDGEGQENWMSTRLEADSLSASIAWWLFVETPQTLLRFHNATDRAEVLERGWEKDWAGAEDESEKDGLTQPFLALWRNEPDVPLLLFSGTSVADGCRFNASVLNGNVEPTVITESRQLERCRSLAPFEEAASETRTDPTEITHNRRSLLPATRDLVDFLCRGQTGLDVRLSTAALLSGRFPFVSPSGRLARQCGQHPPVAYVVDGGYLDTSGASSMVEIGEQLLPTIEAYNRTHAPGGCVVPFFIQIDNGAEAGRPNLSKRPFELNVPLQTLFRTRIARAAEARVQAALLFNRRFAEVTYKGSAGTTRPLRDRYAHFVNLAHPGPQAPLGWTLSTFTRDDLRDQIGQPENIQALREVRRWFSAAADGRLQCENPTSGTGNG